MRATVQRVARHRDWRENPNLDASFYGRDRPVVRRQAPQGVLHRFSRSLGESAPFLFLGAICLLLGVWAASANPDPGDPVSLAALLVVVGVISLAGGVLGALLPAEVAVPEMHTRSRVTSPRSSFRESIPPFERVPEAGDRDRVDDNATTEPMAPERPVRAGAPKATARTAATQWGGVSLVPLAPAPEGPDYRGVPAAFGPAYARYLRAVSGSRPDDPPVPAPAPDEILDQIDDISTYLRRPRFRTSPSRREDPERVSKRAPSVEHTCAGCESRIPVGPGVTSCSGCGMALCPSCAPDPDENGRGGPCPTCEVLGEANGAGFRSSEGLDR